ncbi:hypothetical protein Tco_0359238 [Tanacetum coccineum]
MVSASKDPLTFNDLMATPIDFSKYMLNGLKIENLTQDILLGPAFNLLKGTCSSSIKIEYNFQDIFLYKVTYTTSIMKTKFARYEIKGIEDMVPTLWSTIKMRYGQRDSNEESSLGICFFLAIQHKLFHLDWSDIVDFIVALRMFTRSLILKRRVKDLQLGVESYQSKLNITTS